jgi:hypothetical protein
MTHSLSFHAVLSAYLSIFAGIVEAVLSIMAGTTDISMSLYGVALMALVDIAGSMLILLLWQCRPANCDETNRGSMERMRDLQYTSIIGVFMILLGLFLMTDRYVCFRGAPTGWFISLSLKY